jgi:general secretion pathway protein N
MLAGETGAQDGRVEDRASLNALSALPPADISAFKEKPLFTPSRRASDTAVKTVPSTEVRLSPPAVEDPPAIRLVGIIRTGTIAIAVVQQPTAPRLSRVQIGADIDGWLVKSIDATGLRLVNGTREQAYQLFARGSPPTFEVQ